MTTARYLGPNGATTLLVKRDLDQQTVETITQEDVTAAIDRELTGKADFSYIQNATSGLLPATELSKYGPGLLTVDSANKGEGPSRLVNGRAPSAFLPPTTGGKPWTFLGSTPSWSVGAFGNLLDSPKLLTTWNLPNRGRPYLPVFVGSCQLGDPSGAELQVRMGSTSGTVVARAVSGNTSYYDSCAIVPTGASTAINSGTAYVVVGKKFSDGRGSAVGGTYSLTCWGVPV